MLFIKEKLESLIENNTDAIAVVSKEGIILDVKENVNRIDSHLLWIDMGYIGKYNG